MSDAVMVPREPLEPVVYGDERDELLAIIRKRYPEITGLPECPPEEMLKGGETGRKNDEGIERALQGLRLAASTPVGGWEDISTAPEQGPIMVWDADNEEPVITPLRGQENSWWLENYEVLIRATHWMPLPPPPSVSIDNGPRPQEAVPGQTVTFQSRVLPWLMECFGAEIAGNIEERCDRFIEEALEQVQSLDWSKERAHALVEYVYGRPKGEPHQEAGGVMVTFAALCQAAGLDMQAAGDDELARIMRPEIVTKIRAKQAAKPTGSALPIAPQPADGCSSNEGGA